MLENFLTWKDEKAWGRVFFRKGVTPFCFLSKEISSSMFAGINAERVGAVLFNLSGQVPNWIV